MADYSIIKSLIEQVVKTNGEQEITGANLQNVLVSMINAVDSSNNEDFDRINGNILNLLNYVDTENENIRNEVQELANRLDTNRFGYNVSVFGLVAGVHTLSTAVKNVPPAERFGGQKITFKTDAGWVTYQNTSLSIDNYEDANNWVLDSGVNVEGDVTITNNPDYEDLTQNNQNELKFADKEYNAATFSGLGRVYLRKNIVNNVNTLTQAMLADANTIYIIQYDYDLNNASITIPADCVLKFEGGSITNGSIDLNNAEIDGVGIKCSITNPFAGSVCLSTCLIDDDISSPEYNATMLQMLVDNGIGIRADVKEVTCSSRIICQRTKHFWIVGVLGQNTVFNFPSSDGFVFANADGVHNSTTAKNYISRIDVNSYGVCFNFKPADYIGAVFASTFEFISATSQNDSCFYAGDNVSDLYSTLAFDNSFRDIFVRSYAGYGFDGFSANNPEFTRIHVYGCQLAGFRNCRGLFQNIIFDQYPSGITGRTGWLFDNARSTGYVIIKNSHLEGLKEVILTTNTDENIPVQLIDNYIDHRTTWNEGGVAKYNKFTFGILRKGFIYIGNTSLGSLTYGTGYGEFKSITNSIPVVTTDVDININSIDVNYTRSYKGISATTENLTQTEFNKVVYTKTPLLTTDRIVSLFSFIKATQITPSIVLNLTNQMGQFFKLKSNNDVIGTNEQIRAIGGDWSSASHNVNWYILYNANTNATIEILNSYGSAGRFITPNGKSIILLPNEYVIGWIETSSKVMVLSDKFNSTIFGGTSNQRPASLSTNDFGRKYYNSTTNSMDMWNGSEWTDASGESLNKSGATANRPTTAVHVGFCYFDTTLGKPIYAKTISGGTVTWVDATGATV